MAQWKTWSELLPEIEKQTTIVVWTSTWNPFDKPMTKFLQGLQIDRLFFIDHDSNFREAAEIGVTATPSIVVYSKGKQVLIQRPQYPDSFAFVGNATEAQLSNFVQIARQSCENGTVITLSQQCQKLKFT